MKCYHIRIHYKAWEYFEKSIKVQWGKKKSAPKATARATLTNKGTQTAHRPPNLIFSLSLLDRNKNQHLLHCPFKRAEHCFKPPAASQDQSNLADKNRFLRTQKPNEPAWVAQAASSFLGKYGTLIQLPQPTQPTPSGMEHLARMVFH